MISRRIVLLAAALVSTALCAMPTQEELSKAGLLIQELMKADLNALRNGKKTREQVGDAAVALAKEAQAPAEKYILLTGAFDHYIRSGSYDKAASALEAVRKAIPDWKGSDEFALIEKAMRSVAFGKGGPVRERYEELKERQQYALKLKKALEQAKAKPADKKLQLQVAAYYAVLDHWPQALDAFIAGSSSACAAAAKLEKESAAPGQIADAWWSASDIHPEFLSVAIRAHAAGCYKKAIATNSLAGLQKVAAEKRIAEAESAAETANAKSEKPMVASSSSSSVGLAKYYGVELIGDSVKENKGILSGFANQSYAKIKAPINPADKPFEIVVAFETRNAVDPSAGILCSAVKCSIAPFFISKGQVECFMSSNGAAWDIAAGASSGLVLKPKTSYQLMFKHDGKSYTFHLKNGSAWTKLKGFQPAGAKIFWNVDLQFGLARSLNLPFTGLIDLNKCYISIDGKLWWEGVKGAYRNVNY